MENALYLKDYLMIKLHYGQLKINLSGHYLNKNKLILH